MNWVCFALTLSLAFVSPLFGEQRVCGEAKILSGSSCKSLKVRFYLTACGGPDQQDGMVTCDSGGGKARLAVGDNLFFIPFREVAPGVWILIGNVNQTTAQAPKTEVKKTLVSSVEVNEKRTFRVSGDFRVRGEQNQFNDLSTDRSFTSIRLRPGFNFDPVSDLRFYFEPQANHVFGEPLRVPVTDQTSVNVSTSGANQDPQLTIHQAFGDFKLTPFWRLVLGRQSFSYGEEVLVGPSDWENPGVSFDGLRLRFEGGKSFCDLFTSKLWDSNSKGNAKGDRDFHGAYFSWSNFAQTYSLEPYVFWLNDRRTNPFQVLTSGLFLKVQLNELEIKSEISGQWQDRTGQQAWIAFNTPPLLGRKVRLGVDGFWSSANFHPLFPTSHKWLGWADIFGRRNLSGLGFQAGTQISSNYELGLRLLYFLRSDAAKPSYQWDGLTPINLTANADPFLGAEGDLALKFKMIEGTETVLSAALFSPAQGLKTQISRDWLGRFEAAFLSRF